MWLGGSRPTARAPIGLGTLRRTGWRGPRWPPARCPRLFWLCCAAGRLMLLPLRITQFLLRHREWVLTSMAMLLVMMISAAITLRIALHVREVTVPDMTGKTLQEASAAALQSGVDLVIENKFSPSNTAKCLWYWLHRAELANQALTWQDKMIR